MLWILAKLTQSWSFPIDSFLFSELQPVLSRPLLVDALGAPTLKSQEEPYKGGPLTFRVKAGIIRRKAYKQRHTGYISDACLLVSYRHSLLCEVDVLECCTSSKGLQAGYTHFVLTIYMRAHTHAWNSHHVSYSKRQGRVTENLLSWWLQAAGGAQPKTGECDFWWGQAFCRREWDRREATALRGVAWAIGVWEFKEDLPKRWCLSDWNTMNDKE